MQWSSARRVFSAFAFSTLTILAAFSPQYLPRLVNAVLDATPHALAEDTDAEQAALQAQIDDRNAKLKEVQAQLDAANAKLKSTTGQRKTLQSEVSRLETQINQLELGIRQDTLTAERLGFEIESLNDDVVALRGRMKDKQGAIASLLVTLQKSEGTSPLITLLSADSLSDTIREAHSLRSLQDQVSSDLAGLRDIQTNVLGKIDLSTTKKSQAEQRQQAAETKRELVSDQQESKNKLLASTKSQESAYQQQVTALQQQQKQIAAEIEAIDAALRAKINKSTLPTAGSTALIMPVQGPITQGYGATSFAQSGYAGKWHNGIDIGVPLGTPIYAAADGTVVAVGNQDAYCPKGAYGRFTAIKHTNGLVTLYGHQSRQSVTQGQVVKQGDLIGYSGMTGYATGPHLHFTVYSGDTFYIGATRVCGPGPFGGDLNPLNYL